MQMLKVRGESRDSSLERGNNRTHVRKLTFNITYSPEVHNVRSFLQELQILLAPDKEHKNVFPEDPIVGCRNGKRLKDYLASVALPKMDNPGGSELYGTGTCQVCDQIINTNTSCCMGNPFNVSIHYFLPFVLQRVTFSFCLF